MCECVCVWLEPLKNFAACKREIGVSTKYVSSCKGMCTNRYANINDLTCNDHRIHLNYNCSCSDRGNRSSRVSFPAEADEFLRGIYSWEETVGL